MAADPARRRANYEDVLRAPDHLVAEVLDGDGYRPVVARGGTDRVRLEPFGAIEIELEALWPTSAPEPK